jgi:hypothetical protein
MQNDFDKKKCKVKHVGPFFTRTKAFEVGAKRRSNFGKYLPQRFYST